MKNKRCPGDKFITIFESFFYFIFFFVVAKHKRLKVSSGREIKWTEKKGGALDRVQSSDQFKIKIFNFSDLGGQSAKYRAQFLSVSLSLFRINKKKVNILLKLWKIFFLLNWVVFVFVPFFNYCALVRVDTLDSLLTDTSIRRTFRFGPCLSLLPLFDSQIKTDTYLRRTLSSRLSAGPKGVLLRESWLYYWCPFSLTISSENY